MLNFCTLYNSNYAAKGLAMYKSLCRVCDAFHLYVFAFDDVLVDFLKRAQLKNVTIITLKEFEDEELLRVKSTRTAGEYCWTCTSSTLYYCLSHFNIDHCTYIDADLYFFANPKILVDELGNDDVLITSHRYTPCYDLSSTSGKYCVQFVTVKNTDNGRMIIKWWRDACLEWCYNRVESGRFGDQKYLDDWMTRFVGVHELQHLGGGVAPWNMQQYVFEHNGISVYGIERITGKKFPLIFFHFHNFSCVKDGMCREFHSKNYTMPPSARKYVFLPYLKKLKACDKEIRKVNPSIDGLASSKTNIPIIFLWIKHMLKRIIRKDNKYFY